MKRRKIRGIRKLVLRITVLAIIAFVLAACSTPATEAPAAEEPTAEAPAAEEEPVAEEEPAEEEEPAAEEMTEDSSGDMMSMDDLIAAAQAEGTITAYLGTDQATADAIAAAFEDEYGITVEVLREGGEKLYQRVLQEKQAGGVLADVFVVADPGMFDLMEQDGDLAEYQPESGAELAEGHTASYYSTFNILITCAMWNTDLVPEAPTGWEDFLKPEYAGQMAIPDASIVTVTRQWYYILQQADYLGNDYFEQLGAQQPWTFTTTYGEMSQLIASGEVAIAPHMLGYYPVQLQEQGAPVDFECFEPVVMLPRKIAVMSAAPHPNAARLFVEFALTQQAQQAMAEQAKLVSAHPGVQVEGVPVIGTFQAVEMDLTQYRDYIDNQDALSAAFDAQFK